MPEHPQHKAWLEGLNGNEPYGISPQVPASVIRISTGSKPFVRASPLPEALDFAAALLHHPHCQIIEPGPRHWNIFTDLCQRPTPKATGSRAPGSRHSPSNPAASGSPMTAITPDSGACGGACPSGARQRLFSLFPSTDSSAKRISESTPKFASR